MGSPSVVSLHSGIIFLLQVATDLLRQSRPVAEREGRTPARLAGDFRRTMAFYQRCRWGEQAKSALVWPLAVCLPQKALVLEQNNPCPGKNRNRGKVVFITKLVFASKNFILSRPAVAAEGGPGHMQKVRFSAEKEQKLINLQRLPVLLQANPGRVLLRPFHVQPETRQSRIIERVLSLSPRQTEEMLKELEGRFSHRHRFLHRFWMERFEQICSPLLQHSSLTRSRKLLLGAYFTMEYAVEAAGLFNPSLVFLQDEPGDGQQAFPFVLSLRAVGEGHLSSLQFRQGWLETDGTVRLEQEVPFLTAPQLRIRKDGPTEVDYEATFDGETTLSERILFPAVAAEANGIEDARFVRFRHPDGQITYYATYVAYDGRELSQHLLETSDFLHFRIRNLRGPGVQNKGMALFPRKIHGRFAMLSRPDNERLFLTWSEDLLFWPEGQPLLEPAESWEFIQLGNCGSPLELPEGWLLITHGVGPMRQYCLGAVLLDLENPTRIIGKLRQPLLIPNEQEREGYVPNVVYSCGGQIADNWLYLPYAMSDSATGFLRVEVGELLRAMDA